MKIHYFIYIIFIIFSFQSHLSAKKYLEYYEREFENEYMDILERYETQISSNSQSNNDESKVDPNDRVHVKLWNKLNAEDIKNMPVINDYSNETTAMHWLEWRTRVALRYHQVNAYRTQYVFDFFYIDSNTSYVEC
jgi:hypothetical protein